MKVLIYAAGSVGLGIASCLLKSDIQTDLITRQETVRALKVDGLVRKGLFGDWTAQPATFGCFLSLGDLSVGEYDHVLVCCKSFDSLNAAKDLFQHKRLFGKSTKITLFQNGWGNAEIFASFFEKSSVYNARVITGFQRFANNEVNITAHADVINIGSLFNGDLLVLQGLCKAISAGGIPCAVTDAIEKDLWAKMIYNCLLNPLGAIMGVAYGALAEQKVSREIMDGIAAEIFQVMAAAGYQTHWDSSEDFLKAFYSILIPPTARHKSSMLQDIQAGKKTEIDALNGAIIELAGKREINVPFNQTVHNLVKFMETKA
jgi:2-dehydropantoate 2-reductase